MNEYTRISKRLALRAVNRGTGLQLDGMADILGGLPRAQGETDDSVRDQLRMLLESPPSREVA